ncbi:hypothetical protein OV079_33330 [Nannocystis pusilla]|uniref:Photosynthesis system II assembly factor Ycf48/Hcf136-like domain-containing protein n=1 Tax=Nannocystis pusilla TaxID=889268 RepID=A0A9X3EUN2_9BACT|nr:hypothetical protein [Nannocystis pusilla]MCY1010366.1 hypothetical protein [Nannocystis pusilla]
MSSAQRWCRIALGASLAALEFGCEGECSPNNEVELSFEASPVAVTLRGIVAGEGEGAVAVGDGGTIVRRVAEDDWDLQASGVTADLFAVASRPQESVVVAVGAAGTIVRSADDGATWRPVASGTTAELYAVALAEDEAVAIAVGDGVALRSEDAGGTWSMGQVPEGTSVLRGVAGRDGAWLAAGENSQVLSSVDGGRTWQRIELGRLIDLQAVAVDRYDLTSAPEPEPFLVSDTVHAVFVVSDRRWHGATASISETILDMSRDGAWWVGERGLVLHRPSTVFGGFMPLSADPKLALHGVEGTRTRAFAVGAEGLIVRAVLHELGCS